MVKTQAWQSFRQIGECLTASLCNSCRVQGLRLHDNPALVEACKGAKHVYPIFIMDPYFLKSGYKYVLYNIYLHLFFTCTYHSRTLVCACMPGFRMPGCTQLTDWNAAVALCVAGLASTGTTSCLKACVTLTPGEAYTVFAAWHVLW